ncbi:MAG TPA: trypsin-like peptidase domain-containing protein, partial [Candidatus Babeliales bacterium]|nr:trypsin-like peptidase domain-containing protein [Candidatus Babeliales bacterium]
FLSLGDSDNVHRADEVLALGYPLGQESLKSTTGVISGREKNMIQMSAPINQGSSGGPLLNVKGEVIGINTAGITEAQNVGYIIPINDFKTILPDLYKFPLLRKPYLGLLSANATDSLTEYLGNPHPGGCQIIEVIKDSPAYKAEVKQGDMLYEINGYPVDIYGDVQVSWCEDKISVGNFISRLAIGEIVDLVLFRNGEKISISIPLDYAEPLPIRKIYPGYESIDYEVFGGMVVMQLTMNHIRLFANQAPGLARYTETKNQTKPVLFITHVFPSSQLFKSRTIIPGYTLLEVNNIPVNTLDHFRNALKESIGSGYLTLKAADTVSKVSDNIFVVLPFDTVLQEELVLSKAFHYPMSGSIQQLFELANNQ